MRTFDKSGGMRSWAGRPGSDSCWGGPGEVGLLRTPSFGSCSCAGRACSAAAVRSVDAPRSVDVFQHRHEAGPDEVNYKILHLARRWAARGVDVRFVQGLAEPLEADLVFLHLDLTHVPAEYAERIAAHPAVANGTLLDLSKRRIGRAVLRRGEPWSGPVLVKTDLNHGGIPERRLAKATGTYGRWRGLGRKDWLSSFRRTGAMRPHDYPVFARLEDVPPAVWDEPGLVVERFLGERDGDAWLGHAAVFLGDRSACIRKRASAPVVRARTCLSMEVVEMPAPIAAARDALGLDFGKIDFVWHEGDAVVLDVSRTPTFAAAELTPRDEAWVDAWADGLADVYRRARARGAACVRS